MIKLGFVIPENTGDYQKNVETIARTLNVNPVFCTGHFKGVIPYVEAMLLANPDIEGLIARSTTAKYLRERFDLPVVGIEITDYDFCNTISQLPDKSGRFIVVQFHYSPRFYDIEGIAGICGIDLRTIYLDTDKDYDMVSEIRKAGGERVVASVSVVTEPCRAAGVEVIPLRFSPREIEASILQMLTMLEQREKDKRRTDQQLVILNTLQNGVLAIDQNNRIIVANRILCEFMDVPSSSLVGADLNETMEHHPFIREIVALKEGDTFEYQQMQFSIRNPRFLLSEYVRAIWIVTKLTHILESMNTFQKGMARSSYAARFRFSDIISISPSMAQLKSKARRYAVTDCNIMILGETGTGKEMVAQSIHNESLFKDGPFVAINCAALPENLLESELFGYEEGAFTGAKKGGKIGLFEISNNGTLFLDEIGTMPIGLQAKLLRCLQEKKIRRVGGTKEIPVTNRIICATNNSLLEDIQAGTFREDLYYRLEVLTIHVPPLRERRGDLAYLVKTLFRRKNEKMSRNLAISDAMIRMLYDYNWPGNYRQLESFVERLFALSSTDTVQENLVKSLMSELPDEQYLLPQTEGQSVVKKYDTYQVSGTLEEIEDQVIREAWEKYGGNIGLMTHELSVSRTTLWRKLKKLGIESP